MYLYNLKSKKSIYLYHCDTWLGILRIEFIFSPKLRDEPFLEAENPSWDKKEPALGNEKSLRCLMFGDDGALYTLVFRTDRFLWFLNGCFLWQVKLLCRALLSWWFGFFCTFCTEFVRSKAYFVSKTFFILNINCSDVHLVWKERTSYLKFKNVRIKSLKI